MSESEISLFLKIVWRLPSPSREQHQYDCNSTAFQMHRLLNCNCLVHRVLCREKSAKDSIVPFIPAMPFGDLQGRICSNEDNQIFILCSSRLRCCYRASFVGGRTSFCGPFLANIFVSQAVVGFSY